MVTLYFALYARPNGLPHSRLGITATRRLGKAVRRNRARRVVRESYRRYREQMPDGYDYVVVARWPLLNLAPDDLAPALVRAAHQAAGRG